MRGMDGDRLYSIGDLARRTGLSVGMPEVAATPAQALEVQIRSLRLGRAVLGAVAKRGSSPPEKELMHKLVKLSDAERRRIIH